jgi:hypothetical protein
MAIIVEEEKINKSGITSLLGWFVIIVSLAAGAYYLFFAAVPPAIITPPAEFDNITPITQITFNPQTVISSTAFTSLTQTIAEPTSTGPVPVGRPNPFIAP